MTARENVFLKASRDVYELLQRHLVLCLLSVYALGFWGPPKLGVLGSLGFVGLDDRFPLRLMLFVILVNAGLGVDRNRLKQVGRYAKALAAGWVGGVVVPLALVMVVGAFGEVFGLPAAYRQLLGGFCVVAAMPVAGASAAWSQNTDANLVLSLGLVMVSTFLSPLVGAVVLAISGRFLEQPGAFAGYLSTSAAGFLALWVVVPAVAGMVARRLLGEVRVDYWKYVLKLINLAALLVLYYWNAALTLPHVAAFGSAGVVIAALVGAAGLAACMFSTGEGLSRLLRSGPQDRVSLLFGLALKNNGAAMVLVASLSETQHLALLAIIAYSLAQNVGAVLITQSLLTMARPVSGINRDREQAALKGAEFKN